MGYDERSSFSMTSIRRRSGVGLWDDTDVACFDLRRGSGGDRIDSTGATIAYPYGLPGLLILHPRVADDDRMLSSRP